MTDTATPTGATAVTGGKKTLTSRVGPEAQRLVQYLLDNPNQNLSIDRVAAETGLDHEYVGQFLAYQAKLTSEGKRPTPRVQRPLHGIVRRVGIGTYFIDRPKVHHVPDVPVPTPANGDTLPVGALLEVIRTYDNGRVILACEQGHVFTGTLTKVDA